MNYKRYVVCPECKNELVADRLVAHFRRAHKTALSAAEMADILSGMTREPTRRQNVRPSQKKTSDEAKTGNQKEIATAMRRLAKRTPFSMGQWGEDRPRRTGPI